MSRGLGDVYKRQQVPYGVKGSDNNYTYKDHKDGILGFLFIPNRLYDVTFGTYRGVFFYSPWLIASFVAAVMLLLRKFKQHRIELLGGLLISIFFFYFIGSLKFWSGGGGTSSRYFIPALPFLALLSASTLRFPAMRLPVCITGCYSITIMLLALLVNPRSGGIGDPLREIWWPDYLTNCLLTTQDGAFHKIPHHKYGVAFSFGSLLDLPRYAQHLPFVFVVVGCMLLFSYLALKHDNEKGLWPKVTLYVPPLFLIPFSLLPWANHVQLERFQERNEGIKLQILKDPIERVPPGMIDKLKPILNDKLKADTTQYVSEMFHCPNLQDPESHNPSLREWTGKLTIPEDGEYVFRIRHGRVRFLLFTLNGKKIVRKNRSSRGHFSTHKRSLKKGTYTLMVRYFPVAIHQPFHFAWKPAEEKHFQRLSYPDIKSDT